MQSVKDINGLEVQEGDIVTFTENHTDLAIFDNWIERVWRNDDGELITHSPLSRDGYRKLAECKFLVIYSFRGKNATIEGSL